MTDIRELLREATESVQVTEVDPVLRVRRAAARFRRRRAAIAVSLVAVAVVAVVVPIVTLGGGGTTPATPPTPAPPLIVNWGTADSDVTSGFGAVWALKTSSTTASRSWVDRLDPASGKRLDRIGVPSPATRLVAGAGRVWVIGANPGGGGISSIASIDPATSRVTRMRLTDADAEPYRITVAHGSAWVSFGLLNQVWRLTATADGFTKSVIAVSGGPSDIVAAPGGHIWVWRENIDRLSRLDPRQHGAVVGRTVGLQGHLYTASANRDLWVGGGPVGHHTVTVMQLDPRFHNTTGCNDCDPGERVFVPGTSVVDAVVTDRGLFVSTDRGTYYFTQRDLAHGSPPTSSLDDPDSLITADGSGVVLATADAGLVRWIPHQP